MKREKRTGFVLLEKNNVKMFGGAYLKNSHAKVKRPLSLKKSTHLVLRSLLAKGPKSLLKFERDIRELVYKQGRKHGVIIYSFAYGGNHLHLVILPRTRRVSNALETAPPDCACGIISIWAFVNPPDFFLQNAVIHDRTQRQGQGAAVLEKYKQEV